MSFKSNICVGLLICAVFAGTTGAARADGGTIQFSGAVVDSSASTATLVSGFGTNLRAASGPNQQVMMQPTFAGTIQDIALLDYYAQRVQPGHGKLVTAVYD